MARTLKFLHELGTVGVMGAVAAQIVIAALSRGLPVAELAVARASIYGVSRYLLLPSLALVLVSGLVAMGFNRAYQQADWVWAKALMTPLVFEATLLMVDRPARLAAEVTEKLKEGADPAVWDPKLAEALGQERWGLWVVLAVYTVNVVLSIWRPKRRRKPAPSAQSDASAAPPEDDKAAAPNEAEAQPAS